jgi:ribonuclease D
MITYDKEYGSEVRLYIDTQQALEDFVTASKGAKFLALDTEFLREKTYYPQLCLLQIASEAGEVIIDPLAPLDLKALIPLFTDERIIKVFHAGDQDRIILYQELGVATRPVFDTQRAALLLGMPQQMSLIALVKRCCGVSLNKDESFSDWAQRPLTPTQLNYAVEDVRYLPAIYAQMVAELTTAGRLAWLEDDFRAMADEVAYRTDEQDVWRRLKRVSSLKGSQLAVVREVAAWRERVAQRRDLPRKWVLSDDLLVAIARREPDSADSLFQIRGLKERLGRVWTREVLAAVRVALRAPQSEWPTVERKPGRSTTCVARLDLMNALLHHRAKELHIASSFLASHDELLRLAAGQRKNLALLKGWRRELFGEELLRLLDGQLALSLGGEELKVTLSSQAAPSPAK